MKYKTMLELIDMIADRPLKIKVYDVYAKYKPEMMVSKGSVHNHQAWDGGYMDHVVETMNIARLLFHTMNDKRRLDFTLTDALVALFFHDIEKAFPSRIQALVDLGHARPKAKSKVRYSFLHDEGVWDLLSDSHKNAIDNAEGENTSYSNQQRIMGPLAAFVHMCDIASARIWFDRPFGKLESADYEQWGDRESEQEQQLWGV